MTVHPHVRGDSAPSAIAPAASTGSPPRAWGQRPVGGDPRLCGSVHPHVRGDSCLEGSRRRVSFGSPPRAWGQRSSTDIGSGCEAVHPHVRGDSYASGRLDHESYGSPPRAWGQRREDSESFFSVRFTPTCVGTAAIRPTLAKVLAGSPPRAWGQRQGQPPVALDSRFTPTCVGTASSSATKKWRLDGSPPRAWGQRRRSRRWRARRPVHPHVRGDSLGQPLPKSRRHGSPPRAWGQRHADTTRHPEARFTPTCVGTAISPGVSPTASPVHPHVRGDSHVCLSPAASLAGSPPRAWGQLHHLPELRPIRRFTPTCVGTALYKGSEGTLDTVHPHVRGDSAVRSARGPPGTGSPPRAWGQRVGFRRGCARARFTPTCVGTAPFPTSVRMCRAVHPHVRGDSVPMASRGGRHHGSPPRAWGQRVWPAASGISGRFTPTCVGTAPALPH